MLLAWTLDSLLAVAPEISIKLYELNLLIGNTCEGAASGLGYWSRRFALSVIDAYWFGDRVPWLKLAKVVDHSLSDTEWASTYETIRIIHDSWDWTLVLPRCFSRSVTRPSVTIGKTWQITWHTKWRPDLTVECPPCYATSICWLVTWVSDRRLSKIIFPSSNILNRGF